MIEIIGKNGSGKSYIANELYKLGYRRNIGYTTRSMRAGEVNGIDYFFISEKEFENLIQLNAFADYKKRHGYYYGISKSNLYPSTILVSGDSKKIEEATGYDILKLYIDCDLTRRYRRVLTRNELLISTFNRFHTENFSYLYEFDGIFIDNNFNNSDSLNTILNTALGDNPKEHLLSNREFLRRKQDEFDISKLYDNSDKLLIMLKYEEYLLRQYFLESKTLSDEKVEHEYYDSMATFANALGINNWFADDALKVNIKEKSYLFDYKIKKRVLK